MTDDEIKSIIEEVLPRVTADAGFEGAEVSSEIDFDGESVIRVIARYKRHPDGSPYILIKSVHAMRRALMERGEDRFILLKNDVETDRLIEPEEVD